MDRTFLNRILGGSVFCFCLLLVIAGLQFYGVINMTIGRICFICVFIAGASGILFSETLWKRDDVRDKIFVGIMAVILWGSAIYWLDGWARAHGPQPSPPPPAVTKDVPPPTPKPIPKATPESSLGEDVRKLSVDILSDSIVRDRLASDWWNENAHEGYSQKFTESNNQFDIEFAQRISGIFSRLDLKAVNTIPAREQFKNHDLISLGFTLEDLARKLSVIHDRTLSAEDKYFLVYRFALISKGEHNPNTHARSEER